MPAVRSSVNVDGSRKTVALGNASDALYPDESNNMDPVSTLHGSCAALRSRLGDLRV